MNKQLIFIINYIDAFGNKQIRLIEGFTINDINNQLSNKQVTSLTQVL